MFSMSSSSVPAGTCVVIVTRYSMAGSSSCHGCDRRRQHRARRECFTGLLHRLRGGLPTPLTSVDATLATTSLGSAPVPRMDRERPRCRQPAEFDPRDPRPNAGTERQPAAADDAPDRHLGMRLSRRLGAMSEDLREEFLRAMQPQAAKVGVVVRPVDKLAEVVAGVDDPAGESVRRTSDDLIDQLDRSIAISPALLGMSAKRRQPLSGLIAPRESLGHRGTNESRVDADHGDSGAVEII